MNNILSKKEFISYFEQVPVAVNNLYGDPFFPLQIKNTFEKLHNLEKVNHKGIVGIITKSEMKKDDVFNLKNIDLKNKIVLVSISGLPQNGNYPVIEHTIGNRYNTLSLCNNKNIPAIAYIRPFIPPYNTNEKVIEEIFKNIERAGTKIAIIAGLRGDDSILKNNGLIDEKKKWSYRVKKIPKEIKEILIEKSDKYNIKLFERTSCGISYVLDLKKSYNPYYSAPQLCNCYDCPLKGTCFEKRDSFIPTNKDLQLCEMLGYKPTLHLINKGEMCSTNPEKRTECVSCCTSCFKLNRSGIELLDNDADIKLGDTSLLRLLTHKLVYKKGIYDTGTKDIAIPKASINAYLLNSWWSYSRNISSCYNCSYCIINHYDNQNQEFGNVPEIEAEKYFNEKFLKKM